MGRNSNNRQYIIWQWNCRGFRRKRGNLRQYLNNNNQEDPDIIALQETGGRAKLSGYTSYFDETSGESQTLVTTLVKRNIPAIQHETGIAAVDHVLLEVISDRKRGGGSLFVLNVYSSPSRHQRFANLFRKAVDIASKHTLLIVGDFNAPHPAWGYRKEVKKGRLLWEDAQELRLTLLTDPVYPTRIGNSVSRDTTPDLTFTKNTKGAAWLNTQEDLGSDHYILATTIQTGPPRAVGKQLKIVDWDTFRQLRAAEPGSNGPDIENIEEWVGELQGHVHAATRIIPEEADLYQADARLLHMWEAKAGLQKRLHKQKLNRSLRRRLALLNKEIEEHANQDRKSVV